ncbi:hypothetical protein J0910_29850 [Nocardiopsis sp. CNT-189]|uniref:hypothetical protein n=1 Tax=Nocardiopsis oceanisediminis TaxID=2816862 RepID=UPI003B32DC57
MKIVKVRTSRSRPCSASASPEVAVAAPQEFVLADDALYSDGRELSGAEVDTIAARLERARLSTWWRELRFTYPLGCRVRWGRAQQATVVGYSHAPAGTGPAEHRLRVRTRRGDEILLPVSEAVRLRASEVE